MKTSVFIELENSFFHSLFDVVEVEIDYTFNRAEPDVGYMSDWYDIEPIAIDGEACYFEFSDIERDLIILMLDEDRIDRLSSFAYDNMRGMR